MPKILKPSANHANTHDAVTTEKLKADATEILNVLSNGGVAVIGLDVAYAVIGSKENAIKRIFQAKNRSYEKPSGFFSNWKISNEIHVLPNEKRGMIQEIIEREKLPFSVVAPFNPSHPFFKNVDPFVLQNSTKSGTIDMLLNAGVLHDELVNQSWEMGMPVFGSSANTSLMGSKYRADDIEAEVLNAVDLIADYGLSKYHNTLGRSSTIIDFSDFSVIRVGVMFEELKKAFKDRFNITLHSTI
ncbi:Sua5/YciO/YrdC/YwlC family protein [Polynucleobacter sinensis]|uniref:Sua5/YciO/YrdC/YwlC family protein n=1 Tax=Polynucleobacter sinensis TaxID=1743157 RepID=UPI00078515D2|nr:Sua5/YciO/YrdC/YwlC family protein [Polynucleobacter sinensis]